LQLLNSCNSFFPFHLKLHGDFVSSAVNTPGAYLKRWLINALMTISKPRRYPSGFAATGSGKRLRSTSAPGDI